MGRERKGRSFLPLSPPAEIAFAGCDAVPAGATACVWLWIRPTASTPEAVASCRRVGLSPEAVCISFGHLLVLLLDGRHLSLPGGGEGGPKSRSVQRDFVRYIGTGNIVLCLHYSTV